jgi:hypothetical protein
MEGSCTNVPTMGAGLGASGSWAEALLVTLHGVVIDDLLAPRGGVCRDNDRMEFSCISCHANKTQEPIMHECRVA